MKVTGMMPNNLLVSQMSKSGVTDQQVKLD